MYVENRSSVPITVYSVTLRGCENVKQLCEVRPLNVEIGPRRQDEIIRVEPADPSKAYSFSATFGWRADSAQTAALGTLATAGDSRAQQQLDAVQRARARRQHQVGSQDIDLTQDEIKSLADQAGSIRIVPDSVVLHVGATMPTDTFRVLLMSKANEPLGRIWAVRWSVRRDGVLRFVPPDSVIANQPGRTEIQILLNDDVLPNNAELHRAKAVPVVVEK